MIRPLTSLVGALLALAASTSAQSPLCTVPFASNNGLSGDTIVFFDLNVTTPVLVQSLDTNTMVAGACTLSVYTTPGTWVGNNQNPAAWTLVAQDNGTAVSPGRNLATNVPLASPLLLGTGSWGVALRCNIGHSYTNGTGSNQNFSTAELAISLGAATNVPASGPFTSTTLNNPRVWNGCIHYVPASGLYSNFTATPTSGSSPLLVNFTDLTYSSDPGGILTWSWDFDNDGTFDAFTQDPTHTYTRSGKYSVRLVTTDASNPPSSITKTDYIVVDPITCNFTATPTTGAGPLFVQFTDNSTGLVTSWAWDFDNDGNVDSNLQNPQWVYSSGTYSVKLTVNNSAFSESLTRTDYIVVDPVTCNFTASPTIGVAPLVVNFTDSSTGLITNWAWDFDNDGNVDSNLQNPTWVYVNTGQYSVKLRVNNAGNSAELTRTNYIYATGTPVDPGMADILQYQFNEPRGTGVANSASGVNYPAVGTAGNAAWRTDPGRNAFNGNEPGFGCLAYSASAANYVNTGARVNNSGSMTICFRARRDPASTTASPFGYYFSDNTFRCFMGSAGILFVGGGPLASTYTAPFHGNLVQGQWNHFSIVIDNAAGACTIWENGVPDSNPKLFAAGTYTYTGTTNLSVGSTPSGSSRATLHYDMDDFRIYGRALSGPEILGAMINEQAAVSTFGAGCAGPGGTPTISGSGGQPKIGNNLFTVHIDNTQVGRLAAILIGVLAVDGGNRPLDVSFLFGAGCLAETLPDLAAFAIGTGPNNPFPLPIPGIPALAGGHVYCQGVVFGTQGAVTPALDVNIQN